LVEEQGRFSEMNFCCQKVGRASRKSPVRAYQALEKPGQKWHIHGYLTLIGLSICS